MKDIGMAYRNDIGLESEIFNSTRMKCNTGGYLSEEIVDKQE
jgi:hypothetical protein